MSHEIPQRLTDQKYDRTRLIGDDEGCLARSAFPRSKDTSLGRHIRDPIGLNVATTLRPSSRLTSFSLTGVPLNQTFFVEAIAAYRIRSSTSLLRSRSSTSTFWITQMQRSPLLCPWARWSHRLGRPSYVWEREREVCGGDVVGIGGGRIRREKSSERQKEKGEGEREVCERDRFLVQG